MKKLAILIGNIGCGKSTLAEAYYKKGYIIISRDSMRYGIGNGHYTFKPKYEPVIVKTAVYMFKETCKRGFDIVLDEVNVCRFYREKYIAIAKKYGYKTTARVLPILSKEVAVERRMRNPHGQPDRRIWEMVWDKFDNIYEEPLLVEGFDSIE